MMQRLINAKTKADLISSAMLQNLETYCSMDYWPSHITLSKLKTKGFNTKDSNSKKFRLKDLMSAKIKTFVLSRPESIESKKISCLNKKKKYFKKK